MADDPTMHDPFGRSRLPTAFTRERGIQWLDEVFQALIDNRMPSRQAALFVGGGGASWLSGGGDLVRDYWKVAAPRSSHRTASRIWHEACASSRGATDTDDDGNIAPDTPESSEP